MVLTEMLEKRDQERAWNEDIQEQLFPGKGKKSSGYRVNVIEIPDEDAEKLETVGNAIDYLNKRLSE